MGDVQVRYKASQSSHASRKMPRSPRLAHKAPVMQASLLGQRWKGKGKEGEFGRVRPNSPFPFPFQRRPRRLYAG